MAIRVIDDTKLNDIAVAIQQKSSMAEQMTVDEMPETIERISVGDPYQIMDEYIAGTLTRLRLNNVPSGNLKFITLTGNTNLQSIELPNNTDDLGVWQFGRVNGLERFDAGFTSLLGNVCLNGCNNLKELILRKADTCATLFSVGSVSFASDGKIYVPPTLIEDYKVATNWTAHAARFHELYFAESDEEKGSLLISVPTGSMIVCDYNETYVIKE